MIEENPKVSEEDHKMCQSRVGMQLYFMKHSRPYIKNTIREITKVWDKPTPAASKEKEQVIKFMLHTARYGLRFEPTDLDKDNWTMVIL